MGDDTYISNIFFIHILWDGSFYKLNFLKLLKQPNRQTSYTIRFLFKNQK
jgi:hypothetical protein